MTVGVKSCKNLMKRLDTAPSCAIRTVGVTSPSTTQIYWERKVMGQGVNDTMIYFLVQHQEQQLSV